MSYILNLYSKCYLSTNTNGLKFINNNLHISTLIVALQSFNAVLIYITRYSTYSVSQNFIYPSKELCSKTASGEVGV